MRSDRQVNRDILLLFGKVPRPGDVKTRLLPWVAAEDACDLYRAFLYDIAERPRADWITTELWLADSATVERTVPAAIDLERSGLVREKQRGKDLIERMIDAFERSFGRGGERVVLRNTDSPLLPPEREEEGFAALRDGADVVLGPDLGGGYYLVGLRRPRPELFRDLPMSVPSNFDRTLLRARALGLRVEVLAPEPDVDDGDDLLELIRELRESAAARAFAPRTAVAALELGDRMKRARRVP